LDSEEPEAHWFEFRINTDELTGDTALIITDFADDEEKVSTIELWNSQIAKLKHVLGL
jgi:RimJ/RimL family protein N-acetyltransferase